MLLRSLSVNRAIIINDKGVNLTGEDIPVADKVRRFIARGMISLQIEEWPYSQSWSSTIADRDLRRVMYDPLEILYSLDVALDDYLYGEISDFGHFLQPGQYFVRGLSGCG